MAQPGFLAEKLLVARLKLKDRDAFAQLYDWYVDRIYRFVYFKVGSVEEAQDLVSQTFLKIWQFALEGKIKASGSFQALLYTTARNLVIDYYRANRNHQDVELEAAHDVSDGLSAAETLDVKFDQEALSRKLQHIKSEYQEVIVLHYLNELSIKEIAGVINKKPGTVRVTLHRALKSLKEQA